MGSREGQRRLSCLLILVTLALALGFGARSWFSYLEPRLAAALNSQGYHQARYTVTSLYFTPGLPGATEAVCRAEGTVEGHSEWLNLEAWLPRSATSTADLQTLVKVESVLDVLYNPSMPFPRSTRPSPRVVRFQDDFVTYSRLEVLKGVGLMLWAPVLWGVLVFLWVRREARLWKTRPAALR